MKYNLVLEFINEDHKKSDWVYEMKYQILIQKKALHELILWLETIENEEDIYHGMVSLIRHLHHITQIFANINNNDQIFLDFKNKHIFYNDDDHGHSPIPVYSDIKTSMGPEFILNTLLYLGRFSTEQELFLKDTLIGCFSNEKLISEEDDPEYLQNYSKTSHEYFCQLSAYIFSKSSKYN